MPGVWDFIYAVRDQLLKKVPETTEEQVESSLENYILPILHNKMMNDLNMQEQDEFVLVRKKKILNFVFTFWMVLVPVQEI